MDYYKIDTEISDVGYNLELRKKRKLNTKLKQIIIEG